MANETDFLKTAVRLIPSGRGRPARGDLHRAVSSAYYHLFHLLTREAARLFADDEQLIGQLARSLSHKTLKEVSEVFRAATVRRGQTNVQQLPGALHGAWLSRVDQDLVSDLNRVADALIRLQRARHDADYNLINDVVKADATAAVSLAEEASAIVGRIRDREIFRLYVGCFFCGETWQRDR